MTTFDPSRIITLMHCLESGTTQQKIEIIESIDTSDPVTVGMVIRALSDQEPSVRLSALGKMDEAGIRPPSPILEDLLDDPDPQVQALAIRLSQRPEALNPLEKVIPLIESMASSLGPLGGLLKTMIETLRNLGDQDERNQLVTITRLTDDNPAAVLAVAQALRSPYLSVRIAALRKALQLETVTIPEDLIPDFLADPSAEIREAIEALILAGKVGPFDAEAFRLQAMQSMMRSLLGNLTLGGLDFTSLLGGDIDSTALLSPDQTPTVTPARTSAPASDRVGKVHRADGFVYVVGDGKARDRILRTLSALAEDEQAPSFEQIRHAGEPSRWAIRGVDEEVPSPGWPALLEEKGLMLPEHHVTYGEQARMLSEQIWGAAFADLFCDLPIALVFHDGVLSRAEWGGPTPGAWSSHDQDIPISQVGPLALLKAFLEDPTDDRLDDLPTSEDPLLVAG